MPKKKPSKLRTGATASVVHKTGRGIRYSKEQVEEHVSRYRALHAKSGITQQSYADDNRMSVGTLSRWLSENKETPSLPADDRPVRGFLPAGRMDTPRGLRSEGHGVDPGKSGEDSNGHADPRVVELEAQIATERAERGKLSKELHDAMIRNQELRLAIKNISGSL